LSVLGDTLPRLDDRAELNRRLERQNLLNPFRGLIRAGFHGRHEELNRLRKYVGFLESHSYFESIERGFRSVTSLHEKPPLVFHAMGGMGKSTLMAKFILDHMEPESIDGHLPFVYLDFDRPSLLADDPATLVVEAARQLALQFFQHAESFERFRVAWLADPINAPTRHNPASRQKKILKEFAVLMQDTELSEQPLLFVLDTFEEVQYRSQEFTSEVFRLLDALQSFVPRMRVVVAGRAPVTLPEFRTENWELGPLDEEGAVQYLLARGIANKAAARSLAKQVGGNPLTLNLALDVAKSEGVEEGGLKELDTRRYIFLRLKDNEIQGQLYRRILSHVHDKEARKLAHPGLVLRRVTPELIQEVLAEPCGVSVPNRERADELFDELRREVGLVTPAEDGSLRHRPEVRKVMVELLRRDEPAKVQQIHERAAAFYRRRKGVVAKAELVYHLLVLNADRHEIDEAWQHGVEKYLAG
jgi:hypothetical protein